MFCVRGGGTGGKGRREETEGGDSSTLVLIFSHSKPLVKQVVLAVGLVVRLLRGLGHNLCAARRGARANSAADVVAVAVGVLIVVVVVIILSSSS